MKREEILQTISVLSACIDPLLRAGCNDSATTVAEKIVTLVNKIDNEVDR